MAATIKWTDGSPESPGDGCSELRLKLKLDLNKIEEGAVMVLKYVRPQWSADRVGFRVSLYNWLTVTGHSCGVLGIGESKVSAPPPTRTPRSPFFKQSNSEHQLPACWLLIPLLSSGSSNYLPTAFKYYGLCPLQPISCYTIDPCLRLVGVLAFRLLSRILVNIIRFKSAACIDLACYHVLNIFGCQLLKTNVLNVGWQVVPIVYKVSVGKIKVLKKKKNFFFLHPHYSH